MSAEVGDDSAMSDDQVCDTCGGTGVDPGALIYPEACPDCGGTGIEYFPDQEEEFDPESTAD